MSLNEISYLIFLGVIMFHGVGLVFWALVYGICSLLHYHFLEMRKTIIGQDSRIDALIDRNRELISEVKDYSYRFQIKTKEQKK